MGAALTSVLFTIGKFAIELYLGKSNVGSSYGTAGSLVLVLVWVYYSVQILLYGAEFTQVYAEAIGSSIEPAEYAVHIEQTEVEQEVDELPPQNPDLQGNLQKPPPENKKT